MRSRRRLGPKDMYLSLSVDEGQGFAGVDGNRIRLGVPREQARHAELIHCNGKAKITCLPASSLIWSARALIG